VDKDMLEDQDEDKRPLMWLVEVEVQAGLVCRRQQRLLVTVELVAHLI
jgi:hypothetical protein